MYCSYIKHIYCSYIKQCSYIKSSCTKVFLFSIFSCVYVGSICFGLFFVFCPSAFPYATSPFLQYFATIDLVFSDVRATGKHPLGGKKRHSTPACASHNLNVFESSLAKMLDIAVLLDALIDTAKCQILAFIGFHQKKKIQKDPERGDCGFVLLDVLPYLPGEGKLWQPSMCTLLCREHLIKSKISLVFFI